MLQLNAMDAAFLSAETPAWHLHVGALFMVDPATSPEPFDVERLRHLVASRIDEIEPFISRVVTVPFGLARPVLVHDRPVDLQRHIRPVAVPAPGGVDELAALVADLFERKLEPGRPLWELWFITGLESGQVALLLKAHHSLVDGARGLQVYEVLFDLTADAPFDRGHGSPGTPLERPPSPLELAAAAVPWLLGTPLRAAGAVRDLGRAAVKLGRLGRAGALHQATWPMQAPRTSINGRITPHRSLAFCSIDLGGVKDIRSVLGGTVNDVVLAVCAGGLRQYLLERDELPARPLVAQIPVSVAPGAPGAGADSAPRRVWGNQVSVIGASLATEVADPAERLHAIVASTVSAKALGGALGDSLIIELAGLVPPVVVEEGVRLYTGASLADHHPPVFNLIISNVRGPSFPLYLGGARLLANYPFGPLIDGSGLNVTVTSYLDHVDFGFNACPELVADPWRLAAAALEAFDELRKAAAEHAAGPGDSRQPVR